MLFHAWVKHEKFVTQVPDVVAYEYYECFSSQLNTLSHIIITYNDLTRIQSIKGVCFSHSQKEYSRFSQHQRKNDHLLSVYIECP